MLHTLRYGAVAKKIVLFYLFFISLDVPMTSSYRHHITTLPADGRTLVHYRSV